MLEGFLALVAPMLLSGSPEARRRLARHRPPCTRVAHSLSKKSKCRPPKPPADCPPARSGKWAPLQEVEPLNAG